MAVLVVLSMLFIIGFGAFAVDLSSAWSQRRQNQGSVDTGTVAGALMTRNVSQATAIAQAETEIIRITYSSLDPNMTLAQWTAKWAACTDPAKGPEFTINGSYDCISFATSLSKMRAQLPDVEIITTFAKAIGYNTLSTDAFAEVIITLSGRGAILPFGLPGNAAGDTEICLKTGANPKNVLPCDGPDTGNFQFLDISEYGNIDFGTTTLCNGATITRLSRNIARGIDHPIKEAPNPGAAFRTDLAGCQDGNINYGPYSLQTEPGNKVGVLDRGFIDGVSGYPGRLTLSSDTISQGGNTFDDKPLWEYLNGAGSAFCSAVLGGAVGDHDEMATCLAAMSGTNTTMFLESLGDAARFGWVPLFYAPTLGNGKTTNNVDEFRPVYIQTTLWGCDANACDATHDPSEGITGVITGQDKLEAVSALQIPRGALPDSVDDGFFGAGSETLYAISR